MATIRAFKAVRPSKEYADQVLALPYDVMNREEAARMAEGNPFSFLHISRAEIDLPETGAYHTAVYQKGKDSLTAFIEQKVLIRDEKPALYIYQQEMNGRKQTGIACCAAVDEYLDGTIKKHELTRVDKELDRINHFDICNANTEPVFLTYRENKKIQAIVNGLIQGNEPEYSIVGNDATRHTIWRVGDPDTMEALIGLFAEIPNLYIADGHHRSASACKVGVKRREENPGYCGDEEFNFFLSVIFPGCDLEIYDYNRVVKDLNGHSVEEFLKKIKDAGFHVEEKGDDAYTPENEHVFGMFLEGKWYKLTTKAETLSEDIIDGLDVSILQNRILAPLLGIEDPRTDGRIDFIGGIRGLSELTRRVNLDMKVAFAVYPVSIDQLIEVSDQGRIMPPKSTWFEPKLGSGIFVHEL